MSKRSKCWVHAKKHNVMGFFFENPGRKYVWGRVTIEGEECQGQFRLDCIDKRQSTKTTDLKGRYFAISDNAIIHLCACPPYTQKEMDRFRQAAQELRKVWHSEGSCEE